MRNVVIALIIVGFLGLLFVFGDRHPIPVEVRQMLWEAETFELLSLHPESVSTTDHDADVVELFYHWPILGRTLINDRAVRDQLVMSLENAAKENQNMASGCFNPRHGVRLVRGNQTLDLIICFKCLSVSVHQYGTKTRNFLISSTPQPLFDQTLTDAGLPVVNDQPEP